MARAQGLAKFREDGWPLGVVAAGAVGAVPPGGVRALYNGFWPDDGMPERRGGSVYKSSSALGSGGPKWIADKRLAGGQRTAFPNTTEMSSLAGDDTSFSTVSSDDPVTTVAPVVVRGMLFWVTTSGSAYLSTGWGGSRKADYNTGTISVTNGSATVAGAGTAWAANADSGMILEGVGVSGHGVVATVVSNTSIELTEPWAGNTNAAATYLLRSTLTTSGGSSNTPITALGSVAGRLVTAIGTRIRFSPIGLPFAAWDETDSHAVPATLLGLANIRDTLIAFTTEGTFAVYNMALDLTDAYGNPQQRVERINDELVLWGQFGLANWQGSLIVPMLDGVYVLDTVGRPQKISGSFEDVYLAHVRAGYQPGKADVYNGRYVLPVLNSSGAPQDMLTCRLTANSAGRAMLWSRQTGHGGGGNVRGVATRAPAAVGGAPLLLAVGEDGKISTLRHFEPAAAYKSDADGVAHVFEMDTRAFETGGGVANFVRLVTVYYTLVDAASDNPQFSLWYAIDGSSVFTAATGLASESSGTTIAKRTFVVNKRARLIQFMVKQETGPAATAKIHGIELHIRSSGRAL